jgi:hypothetical protein
MELEIIMLGEVSQVQKDNGHFSPYMWKLDIKDLSIIYLSIYPSIYRENDYDIETV